MVLMDCNCRCLEPADCGCYSRAGRICFYIVSWILICMLVYIGYSWWNGNGIKLIDLTLCHPTSLLVYGILIHTLRIGPMLTSHSLLTPGESFTFVGVVW